MSGKNPVFDNSHVREFEMKYGPHLRKEEVQRLGVAWLRGLLTEYDIAIRLDRRNHYAKYLVADELTHPIGAEAMAILKELPNVYVVLDSYQQDTLYHSGFGSFGSGGVTVNSLGALVRRWLRSSEEKRERLLRGELETNITLEKETK